ncbi:hypothetical protein BDA99DRAFT_536417 [Phascolomyces articulosus]|uniref:Uncharacterized protein n=1 Tax=Phascolomyces articulosus TaxID=60185 RepID=A0AAD5K1I8_9FUNG|nr:hypothetical protein BDA99DRAFT_536417 [Phascolomyces articulosus]
MTERKTVTTEGLLRTDPRKISYKILGEPFISPSTVDYNDHGAICFPNLKIALAYAKFYIDQLDRRCINKFGEISVLVSLMHVYGNSNNATFLNAALKLVRVGLHFGLSFVVNVDGINDITLSLPYQQRDMRIITCYFAWEAAKILKYHHMEPTQD